MFNRKYRSKSKIQKTLIKTPPAFTVAFSVFWNNFQRTMLNFVRILFTNFYNSVFALNSRHSHI